MLLALNLQGIPGRDGNDAVDADGLEYELKSVNIWLTASFSTNHHINLPIINKYRHVQWAFAIYEGIEMRRAYGMSPDQLEPYFASWEQQWLARARDLNNPKIPLSFVLDHGTLIYTDQRELDLQKASSIRYAKNREAANRRAAKRQAQTDLLKSLDND